MSVVRLALIGLCSFAAVACTTRPLKGYEGPLRLDSETALIRVERISNDRTAARVRIRSFDTARGEVIPVRADRIRVLPRRTCIEATATSSTLDRFSAELCFEPVEGGQYEIRALTRGSPQPNQLATTGGEIPVAINSASGPFQVTMLLIVDSSTLEIVAAAEP